ncbi:methionyl-tRNA formyltransferase [Sphingomonas sp. Root710]|uniref:methionyl-tRNA formyltransferase n=1 Tax=Sphingomonas sp. Root710 TaxID=1736594 RepID=UPI0006FB6DEB|nr:methionyl-tRNA formyltransferase [Sphingomonas sp. Root710]KRB81272.1 methionyl-tRNA formyltransferase [Sphingomonas sp. Root710]
MRIAFMGTPDFAVPTLDALVAAGHDVAAVYCQPPRPAGRGKALMPSPVQKRAETLGVEVRHPVTLRDAEAQAAFAALGLDVAIVAAYGLILPQAILDAPRHGCLNVHGSILPRWRGAAPVQRAILAGDDITGVTIMQMERGLDTGPMLARVETSIDRKTAGELTDEIARSGAALMVAVLADLPGYPPTPQPEAGVTYAAKIDKAESKINFHEPAGQVERQVRAFNPAPGAWVQYQGERIRILACDVIDSQGLAAPGEVIDDRLTIECMRGAIRPTRVQRAGRAAMDASELLRGFVIPPGAHLE